MAEGLADEVCEGMDVYDAHQDKIGTVAEVFEVVGADDSESGGGYLGVHAGFLGRGRAHRIPLSAVRTVDPRTNGVYLNIAKHDLDVWRDKNS